MQSVYISLVLFEREIELCKSNEVSKIPGTISNQALHLLSKLHLESCFTEELLTFNCFPAESTLSQAKMIWKTQVPLKVQGLAKRLLPGR